MANRPAPALVLRDGDRSELERWLRSSTAPAGLVQRARIVLLGADGVSNEKTAELVGVSLPTVRLWRRRYLASGVPGLGDAPRPGRPRTIDHRAIVTATLTPPPKRLGVTHWSSRLLATRLKVSPATVARAWRSYGVQPWRAESFRFSTDPELVGKVTDAVGLYLAPPENAVVLCVDWGHLPLAGAKSQIQALDRTQPILPMQPGLIERRSHDYVRHGTTTLFAALDIATGQVTGALKPRHRRQEFLAFLRQVARTYPDRELHLVMDNYAAHKTPEVRTWLDANPRVTVHFTPTHASWMNLVEVWFGIVEREAIRRGVFKSVKELNAKIRAFIDGWNDRSHPFTWTKTADEVLAKANRKQTSETNH